MKIVIDTNVVISAVFFGGTPQKILEAVKSGKILAYATPEILTEYKEIIQEMIDRKQGNFSADKFSLFTDKIHMIEDENVNIEAICRDPDDDKFIACAVAGDAQYIVSGDKDLLCIEEHKNIKIINAGDFDYKFLRHL